MLAAAIGSGINPAWVAPRNVGTVTAFQFQEREGLNGRGQNDTFNTAEFLPLGTAPGQQSTIDVQGTLPPFTTGGLQGTLAEDVDFFRVNLRAGDILDIAGLGAVGRIDVFYGNRQHWFGTAQNMGDLAGYPAVSPLQTLGNAVAAQVVPESGDYFIRLSGGGAGTFGLNANNSYTLGLRAYRPVLEQAPIGTKQIVYLDFDGGIFPTSQIPGLAADPDLPGTIQIPSLVESLNSLGFVDLPIVVTPQSEPIVNRLIDDILVRVERHFDELATAGNGFFNQSGVPGEYGIKILNSRDHADPGLGDPFVTRVLVGGSAEEILDFPGLYGIAQSIDVGNFSPGGLVLTLLDAIGQDALDIPISLTATRLEVAAQGVALTISHELAHNFGIWHTDRAGNIPSIIDANVDIVDDYELGPDGIFGTADDRPISFPAADRFNPIEGLFGFQRVAAGLAHSLSTGTQGVSITGTVFSDVNRDGSRAATGEPGLGGITVFVDRNNSGTLDAGDISTVTAADGSFTLNVAPGEAAVIRVLAPAGFEVTTPASRTVTGPASGVLFGLHRPAAEFTGRKFADLNGNGFADPGEPGIPGVYVFIDLDNDGRIDLGEPKAITDSNGNYRLNFDSLPPGTYTVREVVGAGFEQTAPAEGFYTVTWDGVNPPTGLDFGNQPSRDFGDAPDSYRTLLASGGPSHGIVPGLKLGQTVFRSLDGQPSARADADPGDDGVRLLTPIGPGGTAQFEVFATNTTGQTGFLQAWFDFDQSGTFDTGERVLTDVVLQPGSNIISVNIPSFVEPGDLFTRWRYSLTPGLGVGGPADTGEVEDHLFTVQPQAEVANDDVVSVSRNSQANRIDVLANDFETPDNPLQITSIDRFSLNTRGVVTIAADGRSVLYTPPTGFIGQDRFTYTVTPQVGPPATATVTVNVTFQSDVPIAVDDTFEVAQGASNVALNVLDNDLPSSLGGLTIISVTPGTQGGTTSLAGGNQSVRYTPRPGFAGTEEFTYTISDAGGNISSATATINLLPGSRADDVVAFDIGFFDVINNQPITNVEAGSEFFARVTVEDLRQPLDRSGVFSAFLDLLYTDELVAVIPDAANPFGFDIRFGANFQSGPGLQSGDATIPGLIDEVGSQRPLVGAQPGTGEGPVELFTVRFQATSPGIAVFAANPADDPINETTVFNRNTPLEVNELRLGISELVVAPSSPTFTSAIDDAFPDGRDSLGNPIRPGVPARLNVLDNDLLGPTGEISEFFLVTQPTRGVASIGNGFITYTPDAGTLNRFDSFKYGIVTADGIRSTAEVTLFVGDPIEAQNIAPVGAKPFDVDISLRVVDGAGNQVSQVAPGSRFGVQVIVQDLRSPLEASPLGVFAAFTDILYDAGLARPTDTMPGDPFDFDVIFAPAFGVTGAFGTAQRPGIIDEFGSFLTNVNPNNQPPNPALTGQPALMATLFFEAVGTGNLRLVTSPADALPFRDTLLFQPPEAVPVERIRYSVTNVTIGAGLGEGETLHNSLLPADVNGDGVVTPMDALLIINSISRLRAEASGESPANHRPSLFTDVNNDGLVTALDALHVINHIRRARNGDVPLDLESLSALTPSAGGIVRVDSYAALNELLKQRADWVDSFTVGQAEAEGEAAVAEFDFESDYGDETFLPSATGNEASADDDDSDDLLSLLAGDVAPLWA